MGSFLLGSEDAEIQQRIHEAGYQVYYTPRAVVRHHVPAWRMTRTYLLERQLGNLLSLGITVLREEGRNREIEEILSVVRSEAHPELMIPDLSKKIAVMGEAFRHALMALRATPRWSEFQAEQLATPDEMQRLLREVAEAIARNDWSGSENILRALVSRTPTTPVAYFPLIDILTIEERLDEAREVIEFGLAANPGQPVLLRHLGENRRRRGDMAGAMDALQHSLAGGPKEPATLIALGRLSAETGRREEALSYYRRAADLLPTDAECWIDIARGARELGEPDLFEAALCHARELDPSRPELTELAHESRTLQPRNEVLSRSNERLERFRDRHRGERCVIIGNGPSLKRMDLSFLRNEITFGLNRVYLLSNDLEFQPSYYVCMNPLVLEQSSREIQTIRAPRFLSAQCMHLFPDAEDTVFLQPMPGPDFALDPGRGVWEGYTVTYVALQLAYYMGFSEVVLIGVDHEYRYPSGLPNQEVVSTGDDPNHFHPQYFGAGVRWHLPDLTNAEVAYRLAHDQFRGDGRSVIDATVDGKLNIFPKRDHREIFLRDSAGELAHESQEPQPALTAARSGSTVDRPRTRSASSGSSSDTIRTSSTSGPVARPSTRLGTGGSPWPEASISPTRIPTTDTGPMHSSGWRASSTGVRRVSSTRTR
jgi:Flp pilus assembly protein TadD